MKPVLKVYVVQMRDGNRVRLQAYTHSHAMGRAERLARKNGKTGKSAQSAYADCVGLPAK